MPELPEVQTVINQIKPFLLGQKIKRVMVSDKGLRMINPYTAVQLDKFLKNKQFVDISRRGKYLIFQLDDDSIIYGHLRMSGMFRISDSVLEHQHNRLFLELENSTYLNFIDARRFGTFHFVTAKQSYPSLDKLGVDALEQKLTGEYLLTKFSKLKKNIYSALLDQTIIAGIGNIYANEVLFKTKLHPQMPVTEISVSKLDLLVKNIKKTLQSAIVNRGTTLIDKSYKDLFGDYGEFAMKLQVYGRAGQPCKTCATPIQKIKLNQRSVYFCPKCQY